jgi:hypothetical protein
MTRPAALLRRAFFGASVAWFGALPLAAFASSRPSPSSVVYLFAFVTYLVGGLLCHQRPERSFFLSGSQMPVCARCTGIYFGAAFAAIAWSARRRRPLRADRPASLDTFVRPAARGWLIVATLPTIATLLFEWITGGMPANWIRAAAGIPIGVVVAWIVLRPSSGARRGMR